MSADFKAKLLVVLKSVVNALDGEAASVKHAAPGATISADRLGALATLLRLLPIGDLIDIASGTATWDTALDAAERGADLVRAAFPPGAMTAEEVKFGLEALRFLLDAAGVGPTPFRIQPGQNPIRGGWDGARGHV